MDVCCVCLKFTWLLSLLLSYLPEREASPVNPCVNSSDLMAGFGVLGYLYPISLETIS